MVDVRLGSADVKNFYVGGTKAKNVYLGSTKVWPQAGFVAASSTASSTSTASVTAGSGRIFQVNTPPGSQSGDLLIAEYGFSYNASLGTAPAFSLSGWTVLCDWRPSINTPPYNISTMWAWHPGTAQINFPVDGSSGAVAGCHVGMIAIRGANTSNPIAGFTETAGSSSKATVTTLATASLTAGQMAVYGFGGGADVSAMNDGTWGLAGSLFEDMDMAGARTSNSNNNCIGVSMCHSDIATTSTGLTSPTFTTVTQRLHRHGCLVRVNIA